MPMPTPTTLVQTILQPNPKTEILKDKGSGILVIGVLSPILTGY